jgi:hypothetical protein
MTPVVDALHKQNEIDVFAIAAYVGTLRAGEKPIDQANVRAAALKRKWMRLQCRRNSARAPSCSRRARNAIATTAPSKAAFRRSLKDGVDRTGNHLYSAFPGRSAASANPCAAFTPDQTGFRPPDFRCGHRQAASWRSRRGR